MQDWRTLYQQKLTTAEEAVKHIKSGDRVVVTHATGEPILLTDAMVANAEQYENVEIVHMVAMGKAEYCLPENSKHFRHNSLFLGGSTRKAIEEGRGDFTPVFFSEIPELFRTNLHPNVVLLHLSTPDEHGYCSFGVSCDYTKPAAECADTFPDLPHRIPHSGNFQRPCGGGDTKAVIPRGEPNSCIAVIYSDIAHMKPLLFFIL